MNNFELLEMHNKSTGMFSFENQMRDHSKTYNDIISKGNDIIPDILLYLKNNSKTGMNIILLLDDIVGECPYNKKEICKNIVSINVNEAKKKWIEWGIKKGYIKE